MGTCVRDDMKLLGLHPHRGLILMDSVLKAIIDSWGKRHNPSSAWKIYFKINGDEG